MHQDKTHGFTSVDRSVYNDGYNCRNTGGKEHMCDYGRNQLVFRHLWLAGWHDADMARGVRRTNF